MTYFLGKDVTVYMTTEHDDGYLSGSTGDDGSTWTAYPWVSGGTKAQVTDGTANLVLPRTSGLLAATELADITGIDFTPGNMNEDITYMGKNTHLSAKIKSEMSVTLTKKKNDSKFDRLFNQRARDGVYTNSGGAVKADGLVGSTYVVHDGLTTSRMQNFGYRLCLQLKDSTETFVLRNCCITGHTVTLTADGTQEETIELYSYVQPYIVSSTATDATDGAGQYVYVTGLTSMDAI